MDQQKRLAGVVSRLAAATSVSRARAYDAARAERNGTTQEERLESVILRLEHLADELWQALNDRPRLKKTA